MKDKLRIYVFGASGDLAKRKTFPALFELFSRGLLNDVELVGYARTEMSDEEFRDVLSEFLTCRYVPGESCQTYMDDFLALCTYEHGMYDADSLDKAFSKYEHVENNIFYMALPPVVYVSAVDAIHGAECFEYCQSSLKLVLEKPFGHSLASSEDLQDSLSSYFVEEQFYRIDHYLGKELVQNILVLRFANIFFEPLWNSEYIERVDIFWKETLSLHGRAGYFDKYGIIKDVIQNHLIQILALISIERIAELSTDNVSCAKLKLLDSVKKLTKNNAVVGQYIGNGQVPGYLEEPGVSEKSKTPTYARVNLEIENERWKGVPFTITAGKGLDETVTKVVVSFKRVKPIFKDMCECQSVPNKLVIQIQPEPHIYLGICNKVPGEGFKLSKKRLNFLYSEGYNEQIPDAYASLILDVIKGDKNMFVGIEELQASWRIFDDFLAESESNDGDMPVAYTFGANEKEVF
ncbi:MAG: glucose-6-phosphate dehydrogenase [Kiritimatiellae bacterium]|jgi:glucose-6-phosphate 1-dehydrogenase|nr:glucose-6-phosphate dehydrogenase [Kiritimatiellia bacterium]